MNYRFYKWLQDYVHSGHKREKALILREFDTHINWKRGQGCENNPSQVLELACGNGNLASIFPSDIYAGVDLEYNRIQKAAEQYPGYHFKCMDVNSPHFLELLKRHDFIFTHGLMHHIDDKSFFLLMQRIKDFALKPATFMAIEAILPNVWVNPLGFLLAKMDAGDYVRSDKRNKLLLKDTCLRAEQLSFFPRWPVNTGVYIVRFE